MEAIRIHNLTKRYKDVTAVDGLSLDIHPGELVSLLGINGAGKTTTIQMLCCISVPTEGDAWIHGKSIRTDASAVKAMIAVSPQETAVAPGLTVRENLELICGVHSLPRSQQQCRIAELAALLELGPVLNKKAGKLSGGWQRRLSIAMALISQPQVLFLDEPTLGLDVLARSELWNIIRGLKKQITVVLTTHYMEEAEALSDRVAILKDGRLLTCAPPAQIKQAAGTDSFEEAFIRTVKGAAQ